MNINLLDLIIGSRVAGWERSIMSTGPIKFDGSHQHATATTGNGWKPWKPTSVQHHGTTSAVLRTAIALIPTHSQVAFPQLG